MTGWVRDDGVPCPILRDGAVLDRAESVHDRHEQGRVSGRGDCVAFVDSRLACSSAGGAIRRGVHAADALHHGSGGAFVLLEKGSMATAGIPDARLPPRRGGGERSFCVGRIVADLGFGPGAKNCHRDDRDLVRRLLRHKKMDSQTPPRIGTQLENRFTLWIFGGHHLHSRPCGGPRDEDVPLAPASRKEKVCRNQLRLFLDA